MRAFHLPPCPWFLYLQNLFFRSLTFEIGVCVSESEKANFFFLIMGNVLVSKFFSLLHFWAAYSFYLFLIYIAS